MPDVEKRRLLFLSLVMAALTLSVFYPVLRFGFVHYDDDEYVVENLRVQSGFSWSNATWAFQTTECGNYIPLVWLSHMADCSLYGLWAGGHHLTNLLLHLCNVLLLFGALRWMTGSLWRSFAVAVLFAIHPLHVESVAWISERKDVLSTFFWFMTLLFYAGYAKRPSALRYAAAFSMFLLGLLAKSMLVTLPFTLLLLDYWPLQRTPREPSLEDGKSKSGAGRGINAAWRRLLWEKLPFFALIPLFSVLTFAAQKNVSAVASVESIPLGQRTANALIAYFIYILKMFVPARLAAFYPHPHEKVSYGLALICGLALVMVTATAIRLGKRLKYLPVGWLWYLGTLVPVIGIVQVGNQGFADRYTYVPLVGLFVVLVWGIADLGDRGWFRWRVPAVSASLLLLAALGLRAHVQTFTWRDSKALFSTIARVSPEAAMAHYNMGKVYDSEGRYAEAMDSYRKAARLDPKRADAWNNLGVDLSKMGKQKEALEAYTQADRIHPGSESFLFNIGCSHELLGHDAEALAVFVEILRLDPSHFKACFHSAVILENMERWQDAITAYQHALRIDPESAAADAGLSRIFRRNKMPREALESAREAMRLKPDDAGICALLGGLYGDLGRWAEAQAVFERATRLDAGNAESWASLALAFQNQKQFENAIKAYREAVRLNPRLVVCRFNLGILFLRAGDAAAAREQADALNHLDGKLAQALIGHIRAEGDRRRQE